MGRGTVKLLLVTILLFLPFLSFSHPGNIQEFKETIRDNPALPKAYYGLATAYLLEEQLEKSFLYFNQGISLDRKLWPENFKTDKELEKFFEAYGFSADELQGKFLNLQDMEYIWRCILYKKIAESIDIPQKATTKEKASAYFNWTVKNIVQSIDKEDFPASPLDIMVRGYGCCDRSSWVLVTLARQAGIKGNLFFLIDPVKKTSPHTIALLYMDNKWCGFDPYKEIILRHPQNGNFLGIDEILKEPTLVSRYYPKEWLNAFEEGILLIPGEMRGLFPKMAIIERIISEFIPDTPRIYVNLQEEFDFAIKTLFNSPSKVTFENMFFQAEDKKVKVTLWSYPFKLEYRYFQGHFLADVEKNIPYFFLYRKARLYYLQSEYEKAINQFDKLLNTPLSKDFKEDIYYFWALAYSGKGDIHKTHSLCTTYLKQYPRGRWKDRIERLIAK